jgi:hypothetical protein
MQTFLSHLAVVAVDANVTLQVYAFCLGKLSALQKKVAKRFPVCFLCGIVTIKPARASILDAGGIGSDGIVCVHCRRVTASYGT